MKLLELLPQSDDERDSARVIELFIQLAASSEFESQLDRLSEKYEPNLAEVEDQLARLDQEETEAASALSNKMMWSSSPGITEGG